MCTDQGHRSASSQGGDDRPTPAPSHGRRRFIKGAIAGAGGAVSLAATGAPFVNSAAAQALARGKVNHHYVPATDRTVHWGYFGKLLPPVVEAKPGDFVTIETLTHHANDDAERMVQGEARDKKNVDRRGSGPMHGSPLAPDRRCRIRSHAGGRRQLGGARDLEEEHLRGRRRLTVQPCHRTSLSAATGGNG